MHEVLLILKNVGAFVLAIILIMAEVFCIVALWAAAETAIQRLKHRKG